MNRVYPEELDKRIINVRSLRQEEAAPRAEFMEEIQFLVLQRRKQRMLTACTCDVTVLETMVLMSPAFLWASPNAKKTGAHLGCAI